jgi:hypothetical protein
MRAMKYTIQARNDHQLRPFFIMVADARNALSIAKSLKQNGLQKVDVLDEDGRPYDLIELERLAYVSGV